MLSGLDSIPALLIQVAALVVGLVVHESSHAGVAYMLGDATARSRGRISLNPLKHIDPVGTVILPLLMLAAGGPIFAFAKPVPVYLNNLKHPKRDEVLVSLAGPGSNIVLAVLGALMLHLAAVFGAAMPLAVAGPLSVFLSSLIFVNLSLCFFNLIPLPPLDGSSILVPFLKGRALQQYYQVQRYAMPILIGVLYLLPVLFHIDIIGAYFDATVYPIGNWLFRAALGW